MNSYVYFIGSVNPNTSALEAVKIGKSDNPRQRLLALQTANPNDLVLLKIVDCPSVDEAYEIEKVYHEDYRDMRLNGEWFGISANLLSEIYSSDAYLKTIPEAVRQDQKYQQVLLDKLEMLGNGATRSELRQKIGGKGISLNHFNNALQSLVNVGAVLISDTRPQRITIEGFTL